MYDYKLQIYKYQIKSEINNIITYIWYKWKCYCYCREQNYKFQKM